MYIYILRTNHSDYIKIIMFNKNIIILYNHYDYYTDIYVSYKE